MARWLFGRSAARDVLLRVYELVMGEALRRVGYYG